MAYDEDDNNLNTSEFIDGFIAALEDGGTEFTVEEIEDPETGEVIETIDTEQETRDKLLLLANELFDHFSQNVISVSSGITIADTVNVIVLADSSTSGFSITLPSASEMAGKRITIKKSSGDSNTITVSGGGANIDGSGSQALTDPYAFMTVVSDGTDYYRTAG